MISNLNRSAIALFGVVTIDDNSEYSTGNGIDLETIPYGFLFDTPVKESYGEQELRDMIPVVSQYMGRNSHEINSTFHKSWKKIITASDEQLVLEQVIHYITTYGFKEAGCFSQDTIYIPKEDLNLPGDQNLSLVVVRGIDRDALKNRVLSLLQSGIALKGETVDNTVTILKEVGFSYDDMKTVKNHESKVKLYQALGMVPEDGSEFVRYLVYITTGRMMVIKNKATYATIKSAMLNQAITNSVNNTLYRYEQNFGLVNLAQSFNRYKDIYMALRGKGDNHRYINKTINKISKLSKTEHKPMPVNYLNDITGMFSRGENVDFDRLSEELNRVNIFRKVRLYNALEYRVNAFDSIVYRVRNGRGFATELDNSRYQADMTRVRDMVLDSIADSLRPLVDGKRVHIPENISYAFPTSEKQFIGAIPVGTSFRFEKDFLVGVQWKNLDNLQVDLDLSLSNMNQKIGWDGYYRSSKRDIMFSGDMTDAGGEHGASELFYISTAAQDSVYLLNLNHYNRYNNNAAVPFKIVMGLDDIQDFGRNYMLAADKVVASVADVMDTHQKTLGMVYIQDGQRMFVLENSSIAKGISMKHGDTAEHVLKSIQGTVESRLYLNDVLVRAGADVVTLLEDDETVDYDLSPLELRKDSILEVILPTKE